MTSKNIISGINGYRQCSKLRWSDAKIMEEECGRTLESRDSNLNIKGAYAAGEREFD